MGCGCNNFGCGSSWIIILIIILLLCGGCGGGCGNNDCGGISAAISFGGNRRPRGKVSRGSYRFFGQFHRVNPAVRRFQSR